jgi:hypothetical protein
MNMTMKIEGWTWTLWDADTRLDWTGVVVRRRLLTETVRQPRWTKYSLSRIWIGDNCLGKS